MNVTMISTSPSKRVFYAPLIRWEIIDEMVFLTEPHEHTHTRELILRTLDHVVMDTIMKHLAEKEHELFLEKCQAEYHNEELLDWLEERVTEIKPRLQDSIRATKVEIRLLLQD